MYTKKIVIYKNNLTIKNKQHDNETTIIKHENKKMVSSPMIFLTAQT
jgi:hypothetical protein